MLLITVKVVAWAEPHQIIDRAMGQVSSLANLILKPRSFP